MFDGVGHLLRRLFLDEVAMLTPENGTVIDDQVGFQPPDDDWRGQVGNAGARRYLNVYLADLREHVEFRSTGFDPKPPRWIDAHYLISAWSPATAATGGRLHEHAMLYQVARALLARPTLRAIEIFRTRPFPTGYPSALRDAELPTVVVPGDGFAKLAEFWSAMGTEQVWRPVVYLVVSVPVVQPPPPPGPEVTSLVTTIDGERTVAIAGRVLAPSGAGGGAVGVAGAWVWLATVGGDAPRTTRADPDGRFTFDGLTPDRYRLRWRASGRAEPPPRDVDVPSPTGDYDLSFP